MEKRRITALEAGLVNCLDCHLLVRLDEVTLGGHCPRCGARLHARKANSIARTWALLISAALLLFPANLLPIMTVTYLGEEEPSTIVQGIEHFVQSGDYFIAAIIFFASILVPVFKVLGIMVTMISIHRQWKTWLRHRTLMFRAIKFIGRWSMLDIYVIAVMVALVNMGSLSAIVPASGATYFAAVVVLTMLASNSFDTRLIWEGIEPGMNHPM